MFFLRNKQPLEIKTSDYIIKYESRDKNWTLSYRGIEFIYRSRSIELPDIETLDKYISWISTHQKLIDLNVKEMLTGWASHPDSAFEATHVAIIEVDEPEKIEVMILGNEDWGDMGYDLTIENGQITMDGFGD